MDMKDVSGDSSIVAWMQRMKDNEVRARQRKGQLVRDHPSRNELISNFMRSLLATSLGTLSTKDAMHTSQLPPPYAPCVRPVGVLQPIAISSMRLEEQHRGKKTVVRVLTPPQRMTAVMAIVEDEEGTAVMLQLYYQPPQSIVPDEQILKPDGVYILKEPFFKRCTDGSYSLRVDHLNDIVPLDSHDERIPSQWRKPPAMKVETSESIRMRGNAAMGNEKWAEAQSLYSFAIQAADTTHDSQLAYLNRSLANMRLGRIERALSDARHGSDPVSPSEKGLFREARAHYEQGNFSECHERLQTLLVSHPGNAAAKVEMGRVKARIHEQQTGNYVFRQMYKQVLKTPPLIDCATFSKLVEIRASPGRGRGLFTTVPVSAGQLLLCEKAFAYSHVDEGQAGGQSILMNLTTKSAVMGDAAQLLTQLMQKLYHSPQALQLYCDLHHGDYALPPVSEVDGNPVVDSFLVDRIRALNCFGAPKTSRISLSNRMDSDAGGAATHGSCGIWPLASRINHSCLGNCRRSFIGDMMIIRATNDLEAGTELLHSYRSHNPLESYKEVQAGLSKWGFTCSCEVCQSRKQTSKSTLETRKRLFENLKRVMGGFRVADFARAKQLLEEIEGTYPTTSDRLPKMGLSGGYFNLGSELLFNKKPRDAIETTIKGLEALGFGITATFSAAHVKELEFRVTQWGVVDDGTPWAFYNLHLAYQSISPGVCVAAKGFVGTAYCILVGEEETLSDDFPQVAQ